MRYTLGVSRVLSPVHTSFFARAFPPPRFLAMPAAGIDISDYSIKFMSFELRGGGVEVAAFGKFDLPPGTVVNGDVKEPEVLAQQLGKLAHEHRISFAHLCLPEEHAYLFQMEVPPASEGELGQMLEFHLKENVPLGPEEAIFDYIVVERPNNPAFVNVSVYPSQFIAQYMEVLHEANITPLSLEIEGQATARALVGRQNEGTHIIVDIGRSEASLTIVSSGIVTFTATLENGGDNLTQAIVNGLGVSYTEAERLKREVGFVKTKEHDKLYKVLLPVVQTLADAVEKHVTYHQMHRTGSSSRTVQRLILSGGNANIIGVAEYLESVLSMPVEIGNVWHNVYPEGVVPPIHATQSLEYATAIGLALRSVVRGR